MDEDLTGAGFFAPGVGESDVRGGVGDGSVKKGAVDGVVGVCRGVDFEETD